MLNAPPHALADPFIPGGSIYDGTTYYQVQSILREGTFGKVAKCTRVNDNATVAVKVIKKQGSYNKAVNEVGTLTSALSVLLLTLTSYCGSPGSSPDSAENSGRGQMQCRPLVQSLHRQRVCLSCLWAPGQKSIWLHEAEKFLPSPSDGNSTNCLAGICHCHFLNLPTILMLITY